MTHALPLQRWRVALGGLALALLLATALGTAQGREATTDFLALFRGERFSAVALGSRQIADLDQLLAELAPLGVVTGIDDAPEPRLVADLAEASRLAGFPVLQPDPATLPEGISAAPDGVRVVPAHEVRFTFDVQHARDYLQSVGQDDVSVPEHLDGATLVAHVPPAVLLDYRNQDAPAGTPFGIGLVVAQAGTLAASIEGDVTLDELRDFLLTLPGLAPEAAQQLRAIEEWQTTLPLPIPADRIIWERAEIAGSPGLLLNDNTGLGSAALWQRDGRIFGIAGAMRARELLRVAESFR